MAPHQMCKDYADLLSERQHLQQAAVFQADTSNAVKSDVLWHVQVGPAAILDTITDPEFIDTRNR